MIKVILYFVGDLIISLSSVYCWEKMNDNKINVKNFIITVLLTAISLNGMSYIISQPFRIIIVSLLFAVICYFRVCRNWKRAIISMIISQTILALIEGAFATISSIFLDNKIYKFLYEPIPLIFMNFLILFISNFIVCRKLVKKLYLLFIKSENKKIKSILYPLLIITIMVIATLESHMSLALPVVLTFNLSMAIIFITIVITNSNTSAKYKEINKKYETSISILKEYEVMIDKFRLSTHENKNEFQTIRNMTKDKNVIKYIDTLIDNKIKDNVKIMKKTAKIPEGGLRATIYSKLCLMDTKKIKYKLIISRDVHTTDLINLNEELVLKICKILGVFLDNAIEAVKSLKKKEISIEIYIMDKNLCIDITNNYKGNLDLNKISEIKYTTKGKGHGYGLALVNKIIKEENKLENERCINGDTFTQILKIKM